MKPIVKPGKHFSLKLKATIFFAFVALAVSLFLSVVMGGGHSEKYAKLTESESIAPPECALNGGFYNESLMLDLKTADTGLKIYYSLDGTEPSFGSKLYNKAIIIAEEAPKDDRLSLIPTSPRWLPPIGDLFTGTVLRAIAVNKKNEKSRELVRTFFISKTKKYTLPVIAITVNPKDLFGYNKGIYVLGSNYMDKDNYIRKNVPLNTPWWDYPANYLKRGSDAERDAHIEFFEPGSKFGFETNAGVRINGNATRGFAQKSLRICFREKYGKSKLDYDLFKNGKPGEYSSFILRNSGNDWTKTMFRDALMQSLMKDSYVDIQDYRPAVVFINAEYWGIHNIRERFDEDYLAYKYGLNKDSITILELSGSLVSGSKEDERSFSELLNFVKANDISKDENYEYLKSKIDIKSFNDFIIANVYYCNSDWPNNNVKFWKCNSDSATNGPRDGRWRWMLYDTDWGFGYNAMSTPGSDLLDKATKVGSVGVLFGRLIKNEKFLGDFLDQFQERLNTTFASPAVIRKIDEMQHALEPEMQEHINRWRAIDSYSSWLANTEKLRDFARERPFSQATQLNLFFNLKGGRQITLKK